MKKFLFVSALFILAIASQVFAQNVASATGDGSATRYEMKSVLVSSVRLSEGLNTVQLPNGQGSLRLVKRGGTFSNIMFISPTGKVERLNPNDGTGAAPQPSCPCPMPDACYSTENKNIGMCMCKPCDLSSGEVVNISLLLPAVQPAREAALRN